MYPNLLVTNRKLIASIIRHGRLYSTAYSQIQFGVDRDIAKLTLNRPAAKNAISVQLLDELNDAILRLTTNQESARILIISSSDAKVFCAGADLKERKGMSACQTSAFLYKLNHTLDLISNLPIPTIASIQGIALGGGLELALAADFRVLSCVAQVGLPETKLAIIPGAGGTHRLPKLIGESRALDLVLTGRRVSADEAFQLGLANRIAAPTETADFSSLEFAKTIVSGGPLALKAAKSAIRGCSHAAEKLSYASVVNSQDKFEALKAFSEKRAPVFKGE